MGCDQGPQIVVPHFTTNKAKRAVDIKRNCGRKVAGSSSLSPSPPKLYLVHLHLAPTMSRIADAIPVSSSDRRISHSLQRIPCGRCYAVIEYDRGAEWGVVSKLANEHWKACPAKPHACQARMARSPTSPPDPAIVLPPPIALRQRSGPAVESVGSQSSTWTAPGCERRRRTLEQRKQELEQDKYAKNVTSTSVVCGGCHKEISLDKRSKYYPGLWLKHRGKCPGIERLEVSNVWLNGAGIY